MIRTKTYTAKISKPTHAKLSDFLELSRELYNAGLEYRNNRYRKTGESVSYYDLCKDLTEIRKKCPEFAKYDAWATQSILQRLDRTYTRFFKLGGYPRFKGRNRGIRSFETCQFRIHRKGNWNTVSIEGIGKFRFKGDVGGKTNLLRIVKTPLRMKIQLVCELPDHNVVDNRCAIGIDMGIKSRLVLSDASGEVTHFEEKRLLDREELKRKQRILSKAVKGSNTRRKKRLAVAKEWHRVTEREKGYCHELTTDIVKNKSSNIALEELQITNLVKNPKLARSIIEQNWGTIKQMLTYKAGSAGGGVVMVDPRNTSQTCSCCGSVKKKEDKLSLSDRVFYCSECGHEEDRDLNACKNILFRGFATNASGMPAMQAEGRITVSGASSTLVVTA